MSLVEFCADPATRHMVENFQAAFLAKAPRSPTAARQEPGSERFTLQ